MKTVAYIRVSTEKQDAQSQKVAILEFCQKEKLMIDEFKEIVISSRKKEQKQHFNDVVCSMNAGDVLIVSELSRIGRSLGQVITQINELLAKKVDFIAIKENIRLVDGTQDIQSKVMVTMFGLFAEVERDLISQRTKEGIENARRKGKKIGRPKGRTGKSILDGKEQEIVKYLDNQVPKTAIARLVGCSPTTLKHFIKSRGLEAGGLLKGLK